MISGAMPVPVSATSTSTYSPIGMPLCCRRALSSALTLAVRMVSLPPSGMASRALTARLTIACSNWPMSALTGQRSRTSGMLSVTFSPISRRSSMLEIRQRLAELDHLRAQRLLAREREQLPHQARGPVGVLPDLHDVLERRIGRLVRVQQEVGRHHDGAEQIVEVVRDAAGEPADRLHLLLLRDLVFERALLGGVERVDDRRLLVALLLLDRGHVEAGRAIAGAFERGVDRGDLALPGRRLADRGFERARGRARRPPTGSSGCRRPRP